MNVSLKKIQILASAVLLTLSLPVAVNAANGVFDDRSAGI